MSSDAQRAYVDALRMLARRELSEAQVRQRLVRREHGQAAIDEALARLRNERAIDDARVAEAIALVASKRDADGRWPLETRYPGVMPVETDEGEGRPSRWITLRALRVLDWYRAA